MARKFEMVGRGDAGVSAVVASGKVGCGLGGHSVHDTLGSIFELGPFFGRWSEFLKPFGIGVKEIE